VIYIYGNVIALIRVANHPPENFHPEKNYKPYASCTNIQTKEPYKFKPIERHFLKPVEFSAGFFFTTLLS
jgi:hypothetical protein